MIRMMMWSPKDGDARFKATMHDFVNTYRLQAATTEDFKAIVEKHMSPRMDLEGNHTHGLVLPRVCLRHRSAHVSLPGRRHAQRRRLERALHAGRSRACRPISGCWCPVYLELTDGHVLRVGSIDIHGEHTVDQTVQLPKLPSAIKKVSINHYYDVLCTEN